MVLTIEPGVYVPGVGGIRIEDEILVTRGLVPDKVEGAWCSVRQRSLCIITTERRSTIVHWHGIDYKLLKEETFFPMPTHACGGAVCSYAMLQTGKSYEAHAHGDHEEVYYITRPRHHDQMVSESIRDGDAILSPWGYPHHLKYRGNFGGIFAAQVQRIKYSSRGRMLNETEESCCDRRYFAIAGIVYCLAEAGTWYFPTPILIPAYARRWLVSIRMAYLTAITNCCAPALQTGGGTVGRAGFDGQ
ncbi:MAG: M24 family metallopeptidase [Hydrogeniiclostridium mannosilyticum]